MLTDFCYYETTSSKGSVIRLISHVTLFYDLLAFTVFVTMSI